MLRFTLEPHSVRPDVQVINIFDGDELVGAIYPTDEGVKFISKFEEDLNNNESLRSKFEIRYNEIVNTDRLELKGLKDFLNRLLKVDVK